MGSKQKLFGDLFEEMFLDACLKIRGLAITRFPDGCRVVGGGQVVRVKTMCDWVLTFGGVSAFIDTKTSIGSFPYSKIERHQVNQMLIHAHSGAKTGYVIWLRKTDDVLFYDSQALAGLMGLRGSIKAPKDGGVHFLGKSDLFRPKMIFGNN